MALTTAMLVLFLGGVVSLQYAFRALTGQESQVAIVVRRQGSARPSRRDFRCGIL